MELAWVLALGVVVAAALALAIGIWLGRAQGMGEAAMQNRELRERVDGCERDPCRGGEASGRTQRSHAPSAAPCPFIERSLRFGSAEERTAYRNWWWREARS